MASYDATAFAVAGRMLGGCRRDRDQYPEPSNFRSSFMVSHSSRRGCSMGILGE